MTCWLNRPQPNITHYICQPNPIYTSSLPLVATPNVREKTFATTSINLQQSKNLQCSALGQSHFLSHFLFFFVFFFFFGAEKSSWSNQCIIKARICDRNMGDYCFLQYKDLLVLILQGQEKGRIDLSPQVSGKKMYRQYMDGWKPVMETSVCCQSNKKWYNRDVNNLLEDPLPK